MPTRTWKIEDTWKCTSCKSQNRGHDMECISCGNPKDKSEKYEQGDVTKAVTDPEHLREANAGENWTCTYCRFDNRALSAKCEKCGATGSPPPRPRTLTASSRAQQALLSPQKHRGYGEVEALERRQRQKNPEPEIAPTVVLSPVPPRDFSRLLKFGLLGLLGLLVLAFLVWFFIPHEHSAEVSSVHWEYTRTLRQRYTRDGSGWGSLPAGAFNASCSRLPHGTERCNPYDCNPHDTQCNCSDCNCHEVCGTPTCTSDGNGYSSCTQDCDNECDRCCDTCVVYDTCYEQCTVYENWCTYNYYEWLTADTETTSGSDHHPYWGTRLHLDPQFTQTIVPSESYVVTFSWDGSQKHASYSAGGLDDFNRFEIGANWDVETNYAGMIRPLHVEPSR